MEKLDSARARRSGDIRRALAAAVLVLLALGGMAAAARVLSRAELALPARAASLPTPASALPEAPIGNVPVLAPMAARPASYAPTPLPLRQAVASLLPTPTGTPTGTPTATPYPIGALGMGGPGKCALGCVTPPAPGCAIKGALTTTGPVYLLPDSAAYEEITLDPSAGDRWFCTAEEAEAAGFWRGGE